VDQVRPFELSQTELQRYKSEVEISYRIAPNDANITGPNFQRSVYRSPSRISFESSPRFY